MNTRRCRAITLWHCVLVLLLTATAVPVAAIPQLLPTAQPGQAVSRITGFNSVTTDLIQGLKIPDGAVINSTPGALNKYAPPGTFTLLASRSHTLTVNGANVGTLIDYVFRDSTDSRLVFGFRLVLAQTVNGQPNNFEVNDFFRRGSTGFTATAAWSRASDADLRMYAAVRTATKFGQGAELFHPDVVKFQSDINTSEGNPRSGYFWLKSNAPTFKTINAGISVYQGGEEGQQLLEISLPGYVPSSHADQDGDGYDAGVDCNDNNPAINPGAAEICGDQIDNNCSAGIDEVAACPAQVPFTGTPWLIGLGAALLLIATRRWRAAGRRF